MIDLKGQIALVTGASRGIGEAIALTLAELGAYVIGTATKTEGVAHIQEILNTPNTSGEGYILNISDAQSIDALMTHLENTQKLPSILVNNAGITADNLLLRMEDNEWDSVIQTNLTGVFRLTRACLKPMFRARFGRIVTLGSLSGCAGNTGQTNYAAAKAGVIGFSKSLASEMGSRNITVNVVAPGFIDTDMTKGLPSIVKEEAVKQIPLKRFGTPEDIAHAVAFLVSSWGQYITGATLQVNGGMYMH